MCPSVTCVQTRLHKNPSPWVSLGFPQPASVSFCSPTRGLYPVLSSACACVSSRQPFTPASPVARPDHLSLSWVQRDEEHNPFRGVGSVYVPASSQCVSV